MIHEINEHGVNCFVISSYHVWRPGCFDSARTARYAFRFPDEVLKELQDRVNAEHADHNKRVITFEMLREAKPRAMREHAWFYENWKHKN